VQLDYVLLAGTLVLVGALGAFASPLKHVERLRM